MRREHAISEMDRRAAGMIRLGTVDQVNTATARARVRIDTDAVTAWLPWLVHRAGLDRAWWAPEVGEQVVLIAPDGELAAGIIAGSLYQAAPAGAVGNAPQAFTAPADVSTTRRDTYADGAVIEYDRATHKLRAELPAGGTAEIIAPSGVAITGDLTVTGDIMASGEVADGVRSLAADRALFNAHVHTSAGSGSPTSPPTQQE